VPLDLARRLATALDVKSESAIRAIDRALSDYARLVPQAAATPVEGEIDASQVTTGTFDNARVAQANVTQHEAALSIDAGLQLTNTLADARVAQSNVTQHQAAIDHDALTNFVAAEHIDWSVTGAEDVHADRIAEAVVTQHEAALEITELQISDLGNYPEKDQPETISEAWTFTDQLLANGTITDTLTAQQDDYAPTGIGDANSLEINCNGNQVITGISGGADGRLLLLQNVDGTDTITLNHNDASSTAANRFVLPGNANLVIQPRAGVLLRYRSSRWYALANS